MSEPGEPMSRARSSIESGEQQLDEEDMLRQVRQVMAEATGADTWPTTDDDGAPLPRLDVDEPDLDADDPLLRGGYV
ncbi:hypothetical protein [Phytoactinopolyspora limicola]|uniref:hypothetical protein n=1 Tax=Phytoactinopolyspora limicola TaxID=2715536 RepID=UPI00140966BE|nr:hypothetical protein [Phytoactinopolyspora limicola]